MKYVSNALTSKAISTTIAVTFLATSFGYAERTELHGLALKTDSVDEMNVIIKQGTDVNAVDENGQTALHIAANNGQVETVRYLIEEAKANLIIVDKFGFTAFHSSFLPVSLSFVVENATGAISYSINELPEKYEYSNRAKIWDIFVKNGVDINNQIFLNDAETSLTPLHIVVMFINLYPLSDVTPTIIDLVEKYKVNVEAVAFDQQTALHLLQNYSALLDPTHDGIVGFLATEKTMFMQNSSQYLADDIARSCAGFIDFDNKMSGYVAIVGKRFDTALRKYDKGLVERIQSSKKRRPLLTKHKRHSTLTRGGNITPTGNGCKCVIL